jgi:cytochrome c6
MITSVRRLAPIVLRMLVVSSVIAPVAAKAADVELGKKVFLEIAQPPCAVCHTLADAGAVGEVGPILDGMDTDAERIKAAVTNGIGSMPAYEELLTKEQIEAVSAYLATAVKK